MKNFAILTIVLVSACAPLVSEREAQLKAEEDFYAHQVYLEGIYSKYDPEYVDDCFYYKEVVCEFEDH